MFSLGLLSMYQQEKNKQTNKKFQIFYLKHELTSFEEIQSGHFIIIWLLFYVEHQETFFFEAVLPKNNDF